HQIHHQDFSPAAAPSARDRPARSRDAPAACHPDESQSPSATAADRPAREIQNSNKRRSRPRSASTISSPSQSNLAYQAASLRQISALHVNQPHFLPLRRSPPNRAAAQSRHPKAADHPQISDRLLQAAKAA